MTESDAPKPSNRVTTDQSPVIGIDLGTTISAVATVDDQGKPFCIPNSDGDVLTPTAIFVDEQIVVGREAVQASVMEPGSYADCFKRDVGAPVYRRGVCGVEIPPQVLSAFVLDQLRRDAERRLGPVTRAVITVPAFFDEARRKATQDAGRLAGLEVLDIINEPTAAALAYGYQNTCLTTNQNRDDQTLRILVYDLGGGTFDVTILEVSGTEYRAIATDGDVQLGGKDFDERLVEYLAETFIREHGTDPRSDPHDRCQLWIDAQRIKHTLSQRSKTSAVVFHAGSRSNIEVTRELFEQITCDLLERTEATTSLVVREAGLTWDQIDRVLLVGGSSRIPAVAEMLQRITGKEVDRSLSPDEAVAHGAALRAAMLTGQNKSGVVDCQLINVNSHSLGVRGIDNQTRRPVNGIMIPKNSPLPCQVTKRFTTIEADQPSVRVVVLEGESHSPDDCIQLGECVIRDLPPGLAKGSEIDVTYQYRADGRVAVSARIRQTRRSASVEIRRTNAAELEDLKSWKNRLLATDRVSNTGLPEIGLDVDQPMDAGTILRRLDELYATIGNIAVTGEVPARLSRPHLAAYETITAMRTADATLKEAIAAKKLSSANQRDIVQLSSLIAKCKETLEATRTQARFACIVLGRDCIKHDHIPPSAANVANEARQLRENLD